MTMHLLPIYVTSTRLNRKSRKRKFTQKQIKAHQEHEKFLKKMGINEGVSGKVTERIANPNYAGSNPVTLSNPTSDKICGVAPKKQQQKYTGTFIRGIATMHKSNLVPVSREDNPEDYAKMRRN